MKKNKKQPRKRKFHEAFKDDISVLNMSSDVKPRKKRVVICPFCGKEGHYKKKNC